MADRRYNDKEIAAIFRAAAEQEPQSPQREVARDEGLTLGELQAIGNEVGISADAVAQAARAVDIRLGTGHGGARAAIGMGFAVLGVTATVAISSAMGGTLAEAIPGIALLAAAGVGMIASGALRLPRWARLRERQMEALATRVALPPGS